MLDLGRSFIASVERSPGAEAVVDGARRLDYAAWAREIGAVQAGLGRIGLRHGDRLAVVLQNRLAMASFFIEPANWRALS